MNYNENQKLISLINSALQEDLGRRDITSELIIPKIKKVKAVLLSKENCVVCGLAIARLVFKVKDNKIKFKSLVREGQFVKKGRVIAKIQGKARSILTSERVALNFLCLLSGVATKTKKYVEAVKPYKVKIMDTRKTIPGLRELEKYAVRIGGGYNHRLRLDEMVLIKDNHLKVMSDRLWVIGLKEIKNKISSQTKIEIEVKTLEEFRKAIKMKPDIIMLDNMSIKDMKRAVMVKQRAKSKESFDKLRTLCRRTLSEVEVQRALIEASGGINLKNVRKVASTGVDMISIGALTDSVESIDISLEAL